MKEKIIAGRYAEAMMAYAARTVGVERVIEEFAALKVIVGKIPEFGDFLKYPGITAAEKSALIDKALEGRFSVEIRRFLKLLVEKHRARLLEEIADYVRINYSLGGAREAVLKMAYPQDEETIRAIKEKLESCLGQKFSLYLEIDGRLLGGAEVVMGNRVIDGSVKKRLDDLKQQLKILKAA